VPRRSDLQRRSTTYQSPTSRSPQQKAGFTMTTTPQEPGENPDVVPSGDPSNDPDTNPGGEDPDGGQ
jgi:hypothetical protein